MNAPFQKASSLLHALNKPEVDPITYTAKPPATPQSPTPKFSIHPAVIQPDEAKPAPATPAAATHAAPELYSSTSLDPVGCLNLTPIIREIFRRGKETPSLQ